MIRAIHGIGEARSLPGVQAFALNVKPGDTVDPIVDCITRDRIGYVMTAGEDVDEAVAIARRAIELCRIETEDS